MLWFQFVFRNKRTSMLDKIKLKADECLSYFVVCYSFAPPCEPFASSGDIEVERSWGNIQAHVRQTRKSQGNPEVEVAVGGNVPKGAQVRPIAPMGVQIRPIESFGFVLSLVIVGSVSLRTESLFRLYLLWRDVASIRFLPSWAEMCE